MANNAVETLINDEIKSLDEALTMHAYHRQVLSNLLDKINTSTGVVAIQPQVEAKAQPDVDWIPQAEVAPQKKRGRNPTPLHKSVPVNRAFKIARRIRKTKETKTQAIEHFIQTGQFKNASLGSILIGIAPTSLGKDVHDLIFKGTKYASKK